MCNVQVLWLLHHRLRIWALHSVIRGFAIAALSHRTVFVETGSSRWIFSSTLTCAAVIMWFFETVLLNLRRSLSVNNDFRPLFLFAVADFPWFVYADITLETAALDAPNNVTVFITDVPAKCAPTIYALSKWDKSPIFRFCSSIS
jgi:hypothetical protein